MGEQFSIRVWQNDDFGTFSTKPNAARFANTKLANSFSQSTGSLWGAPVNPTFTSIDSYVCPTFADVGPLSANWQVPESEFDRWVTCDYLVHDFQVSKTARNQFCQVSNLSNNWVHAKKIVCSKQCDILDSPSIFTMALAFLLIVLLLSVFFALFKQSSYSTRAKTINNINIQQNGEKMWWADDFSEENCFEKSELNTNFKSQSNERELDKFSEW